MPLYKMNIFSKKMNQLIKNIYKNSNDSNSKNDDRAKSESEKDSTHKAQGERARQGDSATGARDQIQPQSDHGHYANYFHGSAIREEMVLNFGVNKNWELSPEVFDLQMNDRIIFLPPS